MKQQKTLFVGGHFGKRTRTKSTLAEKIFDTIDDGNAEIHNGGSFEELVNILHTVPNFGVVYWFADVYNEKPKLVSEVKKLNKKCVLVTSKRNISDRYSIEDLVQHALRNKSNLFVEFSGRPNFYKGRVLDPLANIFLDHNEDFSLVGKALKKRTSELLNYTRIGSQRVGEKIAIPDDEEFFSIVRHYGDEFRKKLSGIKETNTRFLGNASFRCERGFPSMKKDGMIYVSRRNIDKRYIGQEGFVAIEQSVPVQYYGEHKPSTDSPIQVLLYKHYPKVKYMLHGHVYVKDAQKTEGIIPCGAIEEAEEIKRIFPDPENVNFSVNLRGHGSLTLVDSVKALESIPFVPRDVEIVKNYLRGR